jgi:hypothetical protein
LPLFQGKDYHWARSEILISFSLFLFMVLSLKRGAALAALSALVAGATPAAMTFASSHREAPMISQDPAADATDLYAFMSPQNKDNVVLVANYYPVQVNPSGPNYYRFADDVIYAINLDNNGDAKTDWSFVWKFKTTIKNGNTFLFNTGANNDSSDTNVVQSYELYKIKGGLSNAGQLSKANWIATGTVASPVIGPKSQADYEKVAMSAIKNLKSGKVFAGARDDSFFVDLKVFDLLNLGGGKDSLAGANVQSIVLEVPKKDVVSSADPVIGVWTSSYRYATTVLRDNGTRKSSGNKIIQVSRLGMPLVNEVVVPLAAKDYFNASHPYDDAGKNFAAYGAVVTKPELAGLLKAVLGLNVPTDNRTDLVTVFLTGVPGLNKPAMKDARPAEMLRLNTSTPQTAADKVSPLGVFGGDNQGFPNGRRLADDVTDIAIQAVAGKLVTGYTVPSSLGDGVNANDKAFSTTFPYLASPHLVK